MKSVLVSGMIPLGEVWGLPGRDRLAVGFITTYAITTNVVISNPTQGRYTRYNIM